MKTNKEKNFISAVVYVRNAQDRIEKFLQFLISALESNFEHAEIICVDDHSIDNSVELIRNLSRNAKGTSVTVIHMSYFHGIELSMNAGTDLAIGDFVLEFDNTFLDYAEENIMEIYRKALEGYDIVSASPDKKQRFSSELFYSVFNHFADTDGKMCTESFRILSRRVMNRVSSMNQSVPYRKAVYANCGLKTYNVKYTPINEVKNVSQDKMEKKYRNTLATDTLILFTQVGYRFSLMMTLLMMSVAVLVAVYAVVVYLTAIPVAGWTTTIFFMAFAFFGLFGILTIIIKYLQILVDLIFKRKKYSFESIEKITK